jgi:hypothetical protein
VLRSQESGNSSVTTKMVCVFGVTGTYITDTCTVHYVSNTDLIIFLLSERMISLG